MINEKRTHEYKVIFEYLKNSKGETMGKEPVELLFQNHDDIFRILEMISDKNLFGDESQRQQFVIGLKLFGDVIMKNRDMELFSELQPAFVAFMKKLKETVKKEG